MNNLKRIISVILVLLMLIGSPAVPMTANLQAVSSEPSLLPAGDVTADGNVNIMDVLRLAKLVAGWTVEADQLAVDVTGDGSTNIMDVLRLAKYVAGWSVDVYYDGQLVIEGDGTTQPDPEPIDPDSLFTKIPVTEANFGHVSGGNSADSLTWLTGGGVTVDKASLISFKLPESLPIGTTVVAKIKGTSEGNFRTWLLNSGESTMSNQVNAQNDLGFTGGDYELLMEFTVVDFDSTGSTASHRIGFKAPSWDTYLTNFTLTELGIFKGTLDDYNDALNGTEPDDEPTGEKTKWVATWGTAVHTINDGNLPKNVSFANSTVRQQIRTTVAGDVIKLQISNQDGDADLVIDAMYVAKLLAPAASTIDTSSTVQVTCGGKTSFTVAKGQTVETDEIAISFDALEDLAVSMELGATVPTKITGHNGGRCYTWTASGDQATSASLSNADITESWYFIRLASTLATENTKVIVAFGDSLTDGASVTTNAFARWPDELARQFQASSEFDNYGVVNMGVGGTLLYWEMSRVTRDILTVPGIDAVVVYYGINDIANTNWDKSGEMIELYKTLIDRCHAAGIDVYMGTLTPTKGASEGYYNDMLKVIRSKINDWIRSDECTADGYIDFEEAVKDPNDPDKMLDSLETVWNDGLHFNDLGYKTLGKTAYETLTGLLTPQKSRLEFTLSSDGSYYILSGIGNHVAAKLTVPSEYEGKPVKEIAAGAFEDNTQITAVSIPASITEIGNKAFAGCSRIKSITADVNNSAYYAVDNCLIEKSSKTLIKAGKGAVIPTDGSVTVIAAGAFDGMGALGTVTLSAEIANIKTNAFANCTVDEVYYMGSLAEWSDISIASGNTPLTSAARYYYSETEPADTDNSYWHYFAGKPCIWGEEGEVLIDDDFSDGSIGDWTTHAGTSPLSVSNGELVTSGRWNIAFGTGHNLDIYAGAAYTVDLDVYAPDTDGTSDGDVVLTIAVRDGGLDGTSVVEKNYTINVNERSHIRLDFVADSDIKDAILSVSFLGEGWSGYSPSSMRLDNVLVTTDVAPDLSDPDAFMASVTTQELCDTALMSKESGTGYGELVYTSYYSTTCARNKNVVILLPEGYTESKTYPVMYFLHGIWGTERTMVDHNNQSNVNIIGNMIASGEAEEMIVVFPYMYSSKTQDTCTAIDEENSRAYDNFLNDLTVDLMPWLEENYSIKTGRDNTAVIGFSMGGRESLAIGLAHADKIGYVGAIAPAPGLVPAQDWAMNHYGQFAESEVVYDDGYTPYLTMICCGTSDGTVGSFPKSYHELYNKNGVTHIWYEIQGSDHGDPAIASGVHNFCKYVFRAN